MCSRIRTRMDPFTFVHHHLHTIVYLSAPTNAYVDYDTGTTQYGPKQESLRTEKGLISSNRMKRKSPYHHYDYYLHSGHSKERSQISCVRRHYHTAEKPEPCQKDPAG